MLQCSCAGDGDTAPLAIQAAPKGASASEEGAEAGDPAGSQVQSGESGSLPHVSNAWTTICEAPQISSLAGPLCSTQASAACTLM